MSLGNTGINHQNFPIMIRVLRSSKSIAFGERFLSIWTSSTIESFVHYGRCLLDAKGILPD